MKKTKINLLSDRQDYSKLERYFVALRWTVLGYAVVFFAVVIGIAVFLLNQNSQLTDLANKKKTYLTSLGIQKNEEAKLVFISKKMGAYNEFIKDDAQFVPYYTLLTDTLKSGSQSAILSSFNIEKQRVVDFKLSFKQLEDMLESFKFIESDQFLKNFEQLTLTQFNSQTQNTQKTYDLSFSGKFIQLHDKNKN